METNLMSLPDVVNTDINSPLINLTIQLTSGKSGWYSVHDKNYIGINSGMLSIICNTELQQILKLSGFNNIIRITQVFEPSSTITRLKIYFYASDFIYIGHVKMCKIENTYSISSLTWQIKPTKYDLNYDYTKPLMIEKESEKLSNRTFKLGIVLCTINVLVFIVFWMLKLTNLI